MRFINAENLKPGMVLGRHLDSSGKIFMLRKDVPLTETSIERLKQLGYSGAYIEDEFSKDVEYHEAIPQALFQKGVEAVREENIGDMVDVAAEIVSELSKKVGIKLDLFDLRSYDDYTYHHSVNVAVYAVVVGARLGLQGKALEQLAQAAICHDLGKSRIPEKVLNKPGRLSDEEFKIIQTHPKHGFDMLHDNPDVSAVVRQAIIFHHENENGTGYPAGKMGNEIPVLAKIIHAVDVYDALTSRRPYKEPYPPVKAIEFLVEGIGTQFDGKVVKCIVDSLPSYPPGIYVKLSDERDAIVVAHTRDALRPRVKTIEGDILDLCEDSACSSINIVASGMLSADFCDRVELLNENRSAADRKKPKRIIIVDPKVKNAEHTKRAIGPNYAYAVLANGEEAVAEINNTTRPDLLIMDIEMPNMNGIKAYVELDKKGVGGIPVIFMTTQPTFEKKKICKEIGAIDCIQKPINAQYLKEVVNRFFAGKK